MFVFTREGRASVQVMYRNPQAGTAATGRCTAQRIRGHVRQIRDRRAFSHLHLSRGGRAGAEPHRQGPLVRSLRAVRQPADRQSSTPTNTGAWPGSTTEAMRTRRSGRPRSRSPLSRLGCMGMGSSYSPTPDRNEMISLLQAAMDRGVTFFDTARSLRPVHERKSGGRSLAPFRGRVAIATKFGWAPLLRVRRGGAVWTAAPSTSRRRPRAR